MQTEKLSAKPREEFGSAAARRIRRRGELPANLTGLGQAPLAITVPEHDFVAAQHHHARVLALSLNGETVEALVREVQYDTYGDRVLHVDFNRIEAGRTIEVEVEFEFYGEAPGVAAGGIFQVQTGEVTVECLPTSIPDRIEVDVSRLQLGEVIRMRDVTFPEGVSPVEMDPEQIVAQISEPEEEGEGAEALEEGATAEPELIRRKESEEEAD